MSQLELSIVLPVFNEAENIKQFYPQLAEVAGKVSGDNYEIIYVDDGSSDATVQLVSALHRDNHRVKLISLSRNFGKELAIAAGMAQAGGRAIMTMDGDGQYPVERIPDFMAAWKNGAQVVIGVRTANRGEGFVKKFGSRLFYTLFNRLSGVTMVPRSTDFRLIDREVQQEFIKLYEPDRITRGLIDWLGFRREYIEFTANPRLAGAAGYRFGALLKLAANSFVSLSPKPLYAFGYLGLLITGVSFILGVSILVEQILLNDPWHWQFTGTAMLSVLVLFLVGLLLVSQGALALYISHIHTQTKRRPLYVINRKQSLGLADPKE